MYFILSRTSLCQLLFLFVCFPSQLFLLPLTQGSFPHPFASLPLKCFSIFLLLHFHAYSLPCSFPFYFSSSLIVSVPQKPFRTKDTCQISVFITYICININIYINIYESYTLCLQIIWSLYSPSPFSVCQLISSVINWYFRNIVTSEIPSYQFRNKVSVWLGN